MRKPVLFLLGLALGAGISFVAVTLLANMGIDYSIPHLPS